MDGFTAAWAIWKKWPDIEFVPGQYGKGELPDVAGKHVLIVDFSYPEKVMRELAETAASITVLDHHETAERNLTTLLEEGVIGGEFDMKRSGAKMAWDYAFAGMRVFNPWPRAEPIYHTPYIVQYVQDRDLWTWELEHSREISAVIQMAPLDFHAWDRLAQDLEDETAFERAVEIGTALVKRMKNEIDATIRATRRRITICGHNVPVCNMPYQWASEAGNILSRGEPFAATYFDASDGTRSFSLRSDKNDPSAVNVAEIAESLGGGGHPNASGFRIRLFDAEGAPLAIEPAR